MSENNWIAEDLPMYMIEKNGKQPMTDEDAGMSAPNRLARGVSYADACNVMAAHLTKSAGFNFIQRDGESAAYLAAAEMFRAAAPTGEGDYPMTFAIQIHGRFHRVRRADAKGW